MIKIVDWKNNPPSMIRVGVGITNNKLESITDGEFSISLNLDIGRLFASGSNSVNLLFDGFDSLKYEKDVDETFYKEGEDIHNSRCFTYHLKK